MNKQSNIQVRDEGIIYVGGSRPSTIFQSEEDIQEIMDNIEEKLKEFSGKAKVLINMSGSKIIRSHAFRKRTAEKIASIMKKSNFDKIALFGDSITLNTIARFIIAASGQKNIMVFNNQEKALEWLKK